MMPINKIVGVLIIGLSSAGLCNAIGVQMLANDSNIEDFKRRAIHATVMAGVFGATAAIGWLILFS